MLLRPYENLFRLHRLRRGIAIFLLAFATFDMTVVDVFSPQSCSDEQTSQTSQSTNSPEKSADTSTGIIADNLMEPENHESQPKQDSHQSSADEDCFCCCSHIIPGIHVNIAVLNFSPRTDDPPIAFLPSSSPHDFFHPPRNS